MSRWKVRAHDADALMSMLEEKSNSFLELVRIHVEDEFHQGVSDVATVHDVGLIQEAPYLALYSLTFPRYRHVPPPKSFYIFAY